MLQNSTKQQAIIISFSEDNEEIIQLITTLHYSVKETFIQHRNTPDPYTYIGIGKLEEIKEFLEKNPSDIVVVNGELKPSQWFTLEQKLNIQIYDRIRLILKIFEEHAERKEAKLQVQLAQLHYERPYIKELIHRSRMGEHPGLMSGGEYQVDDYYEMIKKQTKKIKSQLKKIEDSRAQQRKTRHNTGFYAISLAGYTNAGKSSLLNLLSKENVKVEGKLFSTLSTTTRRIPKNKTSHQLPILLTDTVGFIDNLPSWIIDAFHSTLEEIQTADLIILVLDVSDSYHTLKRKLQVSLDELSHIKADQPLIIILNKTDLINQHDLEEKMMQLNTIAQLKTVSLIPFSVENHKGIKQLFKTIDDTLPDLHDFTLILPNTPQSQPIINMLHEKTKIHSVDYTVENSITITFSCSITTKQKLEHQIRLLRNTTLKPTHLPHKDK